MGSVEQTFDELQVSSRSKYMQKYLVTITVDNSNEAALGLEGGSAAFEPAEGVTLAFAM